MEIIISIWPIKKLGIQHGYTLDAKPRSQLVQIPTPHLQPGSLKGASLRVPSSSHAVEPGWKSLTPTGSLQERGELLSSAQLRAFQKPVTVGTFCAHVLYLNLLLEIQSHVFCCFD